MNYENNSMKFTAVLNGNIPVPKLMNALGHITAGLAAELGRETINYLEYPNDAAGFISKIAEAPFIILKAKNSNQIASVRTEAARLEIPHNTFISAMIGHSANEQIAQTRSAANDALEYWAIIFFGAADKINPLTKKFSLYNITSTVQGDLISDQS